MFDKYFVIFTFVSTADQATVTTTRARVPTAPVLMTLVPKLRLAKAKSQVKEGNLEIRAQQASAKDLRKIAQAKKEEAEQLKKEAKNRCQS